MSVVKNLISVDLIFFRKSFFNMLRLKIVSSRINFFFEKTRLTPLSNIEN